MHLKMLHIGYINIDKIYPAFYIDFRIMYDIFYIYNLSYFY